MGLGGVVEQSPGTSSPLQSPLPVAPGLHGGRVFACSTCSVLGSGSPGAPWPERQPARAVSSHRFELLSVASPDFRWSRRLSPMRVLITFLVFIKGPLSALRDWSETVWKREAAEGF